jgi:hypothetical protein
MKSMIRSSFAGAVFALLVSGPAQAQYAAHPAAAGHACGDVSMTRDGRIVPPAGVDADAVNAGRTAIGLFPIDALMKPLADQIDTEIDKGLASTTDPKKRAVLLRIKKDKPEILAKLRAIVVDTIASGIACHQTRRDLEALTEFMKTSAAQKMAMTYVVHRGAAKPELTVQEKAQLSAFSTSEAGKHVFSEFRDGSQTDVWMKSQFPIMGKLIQNWLESNYHLEGSR